MSARLTGSLNAVDLGEGYAIRAPGVQGTAVMQRPRPVAERMRARNVEDGTPELDSAFANTGVIEIRNIAVTLEPPPVGPATALRSVDGQELLELQVPDLGPDTGQLVLACDETGVLTWHLPVDEQQQTQPPTVRGAGGVKRFLISATRPAPASPPVAAQRSILGVIGKKLLKVLVYPLTDPVVGAVSELFAAHWEKNNRPYGLRDFGPGNFRAPTGPALGPGDWQRLASGRALLFIHGTFSTAHSAFTQIPDATFATLHQRYGGRVFAFNHYTLSEDPRQNVAWLLAQLPPDIRLELDIVSHSRGGLVARTLAEHPSAFGFDAARVAVRRVVFAGVPNNGTPLANPDHMVKMLDRVSTALNMFPTGPIGETLEAIITVLKIVGHGALKGLDGLAAMRPGGQFLRRLNQGSPHGPEYHAIAADFEPVDEGLKALITGSVKDAVMDRVFGQEPNDLVVPEPGVYGANGCAAFPIPGQRQLRVPAQAGVVHTTLFGHAPVIAKLDDWLVG